MMGLSMDANAADLGFGAVEHRACALRLTRSARADLDQLPG